MVASHIKLWIIALFLMVFVVPAIMPPSMARARLDSEYLSSSEIFGQERVAIITTRANFVFEAVIGAIGIDRIIAAGYVHEKDTKGIIAEGLNTEASKVTNGYLQSMMFLLYGIFFRGSLMLQWLLYVGFFLFGAVMDGIAQRRIKQEMIRMNAPVTFSIMIHTVVFIFFSPLAYLLLPVAVTPWFMPIWALAIAYPLSKAISNAAKIR